MGVHTMLGLKCDHRRGVISTTRIDGRKIDVFSCKAMGCCTLVNEGFTKNGEMLPICEDSDGRPCNRFQEAQTSGEPVGDALHELLQKIGAILPGCGECAAMRIQMNNWGVAGCRSHREEIIAHLKRKAPSVGLIRMVLIGLRGYWSAESVLDEALKRAESGFP